MPAGLKEWVLWVHCTDMKGKGQGGVDRADTSDLSSLLFFRVQLGFQHPVQGPESFV